MAESQYVRPTRGNPSLGRHVLLGIAGAMLGVSIAEDEWGLLSGLLLGLLFASRSTLRKEITHQASRLAELERHLSEGITPAGPAQVASEDAASERIPDEPAASPAAPRETVVAGPRPDLESRPVAPSAPPAPAPDPAAAPTPRGPDVLEKAVGAVRSFFFGGNTVVRVGLLVLLVGLTLLAKYAADNALFPIEARLASAAVVGLALVALGFRQRLDRPGFGLSLQGGGIAALYMVTFFAFKPYALVPAGMAFAIFVGLALSTILLSVLQKSEPLVVIGTLGGFLAPVLSSTGEGSHVALFSYYTLLIASVAAVAWRQSWRWPGLVAFYLTYGVATVWGIDRYDPELYSTTQPFVLIALVLFTGIAVLHAWARPPQLRGFIDGTLVFGTPIASILYQRVLVEDFELGLAFSAAGFAVFYLACALFVRRSGPDEARPLSESFLAIAIGFATMAIPFAFDEALTTSIAWSLEGAGLYWVGARQARLFPRLAGLTLQAMAGVAFFVSLEFDHIDTSTFVPIANGRAISCLAITLAGLFIARTAWVSRATHHRVETGIAQALGAWAIVWWTGGALAELDQFVSDDWIVASVVALLAGTALALELGAARWDWKIGRLYALVSLPAAGIVFLAALDESPHLLADFGWIAWPLLFASLYFLWARLGSLGDASPDAAFDRALVRAFRVGSLWLLALFVPCALGGLVGTGFGLDNDWQIAGFGAALAAVLLAAVSLHERQRPPFERDPRSALAAGLGPVAALAALTILGMQIGGTGDASPLPHVPVVNPLDAAVWLLALSLWVYWRRVSSVFLPTLDGAQKAMLIATPIALAFASLNGMLARAVHRWTEVPYRASSLWDSVEMQVSISIAWTIVGLVGMLLSSRRGWREPWMGCAALLGVVVVKLFTVDLSQLSTVARIGTFLAVGVMLLILGYFSPVPPTVEDPPEDQIGESV